MFTDFQPEPRRLSVVREEIAARKVEIEARWAEVIHFGLIVADQSDLGRVDELSLVDYRAARERWSAAVRDLDDERTKAVTENTITLLRNVHPSRLRVVR